MICNESLEEEEETQLQCSLPLYLDSLFGVHTRMSASALEQQHNDGMKFGEENLPALKTHRCTAHAHVVPSVEEENEASKAGMDKPLFSSSINSAPKQVSVLGTEQRDGLVESGFDLPAKMCRVETYTCPQGCTVLSACANVGAGKLVSLFCIVMQG